MCVEREAPRTAREGGREGCEKWQVKYAGVIYRNYGPEFTSVGRGSAKFPSSSSLPLYTSVRVITSNELS